MHKVCSVCGTRFEREGGFFLGSIYINYGLTALIVAIVYPILVFNEILPTHVAMALALGFVVVFPLLFFPHARSLWMGFDQYWDPRERDEEQPDRQDAFRDR
jgi:Ca2+/Na+ antiporter